MKNEANLKKMKNEADLKDLMARGAALRLADAITDLAQPCSDNPLALAVCQRFAADFEQVLVDLGLISSQYAQHLADVRAEGWPLA